MIRYLSNPYWMICISALPFFGKTLEEEGGFVYGGCRGTTALQPSRCRAFASRQPRFGNAPLMGILSPRWGLFGICFLFCRGFIAFHHLPKFLRHSVTWAVARRNPGGVTAHQAGGVNPCR